MDERRIITGLADIRKLAVESPRAVKAIDALMQEMVFGCWPSDVDEPVKPTPAPRPPRKIEFSL